MSNKVKWFFLKRFAIIFSILYSISIGIYFMWSYKPLELITSDIDIPTLAETNQIIQPMNRDNLILFLIGFDITAVE